ncbi:hypothetical protein EK904_014453 [Melospiza melodia maxima]|nr:hypothetical protein EK904_014453 [Melospiza melodia maxima]
MQYFEMQRKTVYHKWFMLFIEEGLADTTAASAVVSQELCSFSLKWYTQNSGLFGETLKTS